MDSDGQSTAPGWELSEALFELQRYLSDEIAPLMVTDSVELLLRQPAELTGEQIHEWAREQYSTSGGQAPISDYLFHAVKKLHILTEYKLIEAGTLAPFLERIANHLLLACPPDDRQLLAENIGRLGKVESVLSAPVQVLHRQTGTERVLTAARPTSGAVPAVPSASAEASAALSDGIRRFTLLLNRLQPTGPTTEKPPAPEKRSVLLSEMLALAARDSRSQSELDSYLSRLHDLGLDSRMDQVLRSLSATLPSWALPVSPESPGSADGPTSLPAVESLHQFVTLAGDPGDGARRFHELVRAAVEQFNEGSLGRSVTMIQLAERIIEEKKVDPERADLTRRSVHEAIDVDRLRAYAEDASRQAMLKKVLTFFPAFLPQGLLTELESEGKRERRRLLVTLLQIHGGDARRAALEKLAEPLSLASGQAGWYFHRNLLNVLRRIPRPPEEPVDMEIELLATMSHPGQHILLIKDAIANLAQIKHARTVTVLIAMAREFEALLLQEGGSGYSVEEILTVLDRAYSGLARIATPEAIAAVVEHGLASQSAFGETMSRLVELSTVDLSSSGPVLDRLLSALRRELPRKVFGFVIARRAQNIEFLVRALSGTPTPDVRRILREISDTYNDQPFALAAAEALKNFEVPAAAPAVEGAGGPSLSGDLELFGFPNLLQNLATSEVTGVLTLTSRSGDVIGSLGFESGKLSNCRSGILRGKDAVYQLFETPLPGSFAFVARRERSGAAGEPQTLMDVIPLIFEGSRRFDELRQARAIVSESALLSPTGTPPTSPAEERDATLTQGVWSRIVDGATAQECEADFFVDSFRIHRLLVHWIEEGALKTREIHTATA
jgi:hypothetical protein